MQFGLRIPNPKARGQPPSCVLMIPKRRPGCEASHGCLALKRGTPRKTDPLLIDHGVGRCDSFDVMVIGGQWRGGISLTS